MVKRLHEHGYRFSWPPTIGALTPRQQALLQLAERAETYLEYERNEREKAARETGSRPDHFGDVTESRRSAFQ
jgi:hypothetical protein